MELRYRWKHGNVKMKLKLVELVDKSIAWAVAVSFSFETHVVLNFIPITIFLLFESNEPTPVNIKVPSREFNCYSCYGLRPNDSFSRCHSMYWS